MFGLLRGRYSPIFTSESIRYRRLPGKAIPIPRTQIERIDLPGTQTTAKNVGRSIYETLNVTVPRRGVTGVNKIGYIMT